MKTWNFEELRELCRGKGVSEKAISDWSIYASSLDLRYMRAKTHAEHAHNIWKDLLSQSFSFGDDRYVNAEFSYEACVEACVQSLHSMADLLSQILNIIVLGGYFKVSDSTFKRVAGHMKKHGIAPDILDKIYNLISSNEFSYINAFCNTIKHRQLIRTEYRAEYGKDYRNEEGLIFVEFNYGHITYPKTWAIDIIEEYRNNIFELIIDIGLTINDYLR